MNQQWFMQDGTTRTVNATLELLKPNFGHRVISRRTNYPWTAHSPDLNPLDFFLWRYAKDHVHADKPRTFQEQSELLQDLLKQSQQLCAKGLL